MKTSSPLPLEVAVKLLDRVIEKAVSLSPDIVRLVGTLESLADSVEKIASNLLIVAQNQAVHHQMIMQMWHVHQSVMNKLHDNSIEKMPPIDGKESKKADKPN